MGIAAMADQWACQIFGAARSSSVGIIFDGTGGFLEVPSLQRPWPTFMPCRQENLEDFNQGGGRQE